MCHSKRTCACCGLCCRPTPAACANCLTSSKVKSFFCCCCCSVIAPCFSSAWHHCQAGMRSMLTNWPACENFRNGLWILRNLRKLNDLRKLRAGAPLPQACPGNAWSARALAPQRLPLRLPPNARSARAKINRRHGQAMPPWLRLVIPWQSATGRCGLAAVLGEQTLRLGLLGCCAHHAGIG